ncbi:MAG: DUF5700 domain-containing putative Zn-dependent protease [Cyclobacteriaceae bacterium]
MNLKNLLLVLCSCIICTLKAQEINITYDYASAYKLIEIFDSKKLTDQDFKELLKLEGTQAYLKKVATFFPNISPETYKEALKAALNGNFPDNSPYMFKRLVPLLPETKKLLKQVSENQTVLTQNAVSKLKAYSPTAININATVYLTLGVIGGGWTFDDNPNAFYVDLSSMKGDFLGLSYLSTHELYHLVQYRFMKEINKSDKVNYLLDQMIREGSATYVADFSKIEASGSYIDFSKKEYQRNFRRLETNFVLFENLIFQAQNDKQADVESLYNIGYSGMYQSPMYYVGYRIIKLVEKYHGRETLIHLMGKSPKQLFLAYVEAYKNHKEDDEFVPFSESMIRILNSL